MPARSAETAADRLRADPALSRHLLGPPPLPDLELRHAFPAGAWPGSARRGGGLRALGQALQLVGVQLGQHISSASARWPPRPGARALRKSATTGARVRKSTTSSAIPTGSGCGGSPAGGRGAAARPGPSVGRPCRRGPGRGEVSQLDTWAGPGSPEGRAPPSGACRRAARRLLSGSDTWERPASTSARTLPTVLGEQPTSSAMARSLRSGTSASSRRMEARLSRALNRTPCALLSATAACTASGQTCARPRTGYRAAAAPTPSGGAARRREHPTVDLGDARRRKLVRPLGIVLWIVPSIPGPHLLDKR